MNNKYKIKRNVYTCPKCGKKTLEDRSAFIMSEYKCINPKCDYHEVDAGIAIDYDYK